MDTDVLREIGVIPTTPRRAYADDYGLRIGRRATLAHSPGHRAYGMIFALTADELERLYSAPGLEEYRSETISATTFEGEQLDVSCYNLPVPPTPGEGNPDYAARLRVVLTKLGFPSEYIASVS
jgi:hypothetical protein